MSSSFTNFVLRLQSYRRHPGMVLSYEEYYKSAFYKEMLEIYLSGHIPCGWNGKYPEGNIFIY
ncbi:hypothetical protein COM14_03595 [Bacillus pseudomycoides]|nr:hypothetical protein COM14_03595 [Bacillus pseudomycoides]